MAKTDMTEFEISKVITQSTIFVICLLVILTPVVILVLALGFLLIAQSIVLEELSLIEIIEWYLLELLLFAGSAYLLYRLMIVSVEKHLIEALNALEFSESTDTDDDDQDSQQLRSEDQRK